jgi:hypothetical protein
MIKTDIADALAASAAILDLPLLLVPFTTTIVLVMGAPESQQSQPRNIALAPVFLVWILAYSVFWCAGLFAAPAASINAATQADTRNMPRVGLSTSRRR